MAERFTLDIRNFVKKTKTKQHLIVRKVMLDIITRIIERSPVGNPEIWAINRNRPPGARLRAPRGYVGGRFRGNWQLAYSGNEPSDPIDRIDPSGSSTIDKLSYVVGDQPAGHRWTLVNNLPYAIPLENGWSKQAPAGMVGLTVVEFKGLVTSVASEMANQ
jgi:hypothetical protein